MEGIILDIDLVESILTDINNKLETLQSIEQGILNLNSYFYLLIFCLAGVGLILLFYKFLKIFI